MAAAFDFLCRLKQQQCELCCNYFVNTLLKEFTSTTTISSQVVRPPTSKGAFRYDDFEYYRYGCSAQRSVLSPRELIPQQLNFARLDSCAWRGWPVVNLAAGSSGHSPRTV